MTTFDVAIYSMILDLQTGAKEPPRLKCQRLKLSNTKLFETDETGKKLARLTFISFGEKIRDDQLDGATFKTKIMKVLFSKNINDAKEKEPILAKIAYEGTENINKLQAENAPIEQVFSAYGDMIQASFEQFAQLSPEFIKVFRSIGEWTFFIDMVCDYADDYKTGSYNGFKTEGCPTFEDYFNLHWTEFSKIEEKLTGNMVSSMYGIKTDNSLWHTVFKIIMQASNNIIPSLVEGKDISFHYFKELRKQQKNISHEKKLRSIYEEKDD